MAEIEAALKEDRHPNWRLADLAGAKLGGVDRRTIGGLLGQSNPESTEHCFGSEDDLQLAAVLLLDSDPPNNVRRQRDRLRPTPRK